LDVQALDHAAHFTHVDAAAVHPDLAVGAQRDENVAALAVLRRRRVRAYHGDAGLLDEGRGDDEEDQQIENEVEHGREIDPMVLAFTGYVAMSPHDSTPRY